MSRQIGLSPMIPASEPSHAYALRVLTCWLSEVACPLKSIEVLRSHFAIQRKIEGQDDVPPAAIRIVTTMLAQ
jgi:hypothetical protein